MHLQHFRLGEKCILKATPGSGDTAIDEGSLHAASTQVRRLAFDLTSARELLLHLLRCADEDTAYHCRVADNAKQDLVEIVQEWQCVINKLCVVDCITRPVEYVYERALAHHEAVGIVFPCSRELASVLALPGYRNPTRGMSTMTIRAGEQCKLAMDMHLLDLEAPLVSIGQPTVSEVQKSPTGHVDSTAAIESASRKPGQDGKEGLRASMAYILSGVGMVERTPAVFMYPSAHEAISMAARHLVSYCAIDQDVCSQALSDVRIRGLIRGVLERWFVGLEACTDALPLELEEASSWLRQTPQAASLNARRTAARHRTNDDHGAVPDLEPGFSSAGSEGWSREMSKTEAGRLLGGGSSDRACRDHLSSLLDGRTDAIDSRTDQRHRFCLAWIRSIEPAAVDKFRSK